MGNSRGFAKEQGSSFVVISSDTAKPEFSFIATDLCCENCEENEGAFNVLGGF
jgi:predicted ATP-grasp superfamily ATP-dependent carboligase